ncbi:MAG: hemolysin family protein [Marinovum sp.]|nr:hemolysin family protein [Marinovum sp.]
MDDLDGPSKAAQSAHANLVHPPASPGFLRRVFGARDPRSTEHHVNGSAPAHIAPKIGMANLRHMRVEDVAVPKADITAIPITMTRDDLVDTFRASGFSRLPVFDGTLDTPLGFVHLKDFALKHGFNGKGGRMSLKAMMRPLLFVPPSMPIGVLLAKMQTERRHMALVIDEYGGVDGLVTIEDLIEQVIGEIEDEHDLEEDKLFTQEKPGCYTALSKTPLEDFHAEIGMDLTAHDEVDSEDIDTLGGLVFMLAGRVPARGEVVPHPDGPEFEVVDADARRIKRLRVRLTAPSAGLSSQASEDATGSDA